MPVAVAIDAMPEDGRLHNPHNIVLKAKPGKRYKYREPSKWKRHSFICFDGEGYDINGRHEYVYLAAYDACDIFSIKDEKGLGTEACFNFLVEVAESDKYGICVIYGGSYDANMMLRDLPHETIRTLHVTGQARWGDWFIRYAQRKYLMVHHVPTKRTCQLWDVIGFFQSSFQSSLQQWLGIVDDTIASGKKSRSKFKAEQLDKFIIPYCNKELEYFYQLMQALWVALVNAGFKLSRWDGAGAIAGFLFKSRGMAAYKGSPEAQEEHYDKARSAYAGGRFELLRPGDFRQTVYNYDINSAYPYAICLLPEFQPLEHITNLDGYVISDYDLCYIDYDNPTSFMDAATGGMYSSGSNTPISKPGPLPPFFHRAPTHTVGYTPNVRRWCWGVEINTARRCGYTVSVTDVWHWPDNGLRPWAWVGQLYDHRRTLKAEGNSAEKAIKLGINSLYGKMVQQKGWHEGDEIPKTHQLYWGGWVTAKTRSMIFEAMCIDPDGVIAVETDGIYTTTELPLDIGPKLGQWEQTVYQDFTYCQSGMYFGTPMGGKAVAKYRGLDKGTLTRDKVLKAYEDYEKDRKTRLTVKAHSTRFRTMGTSLVSEGRMEEWRQWVKETKTVQLDPVMPFRRSAGKRMHDPFCKEPFGIGHHHNTIPRHIDTVESVPYSVLWINPEEKAQYFRELEEQREGAIVDL